MLLALLETYSPWFLWVVGTNVLFVAEFWLLGILMLWLESRGTTWLLAFKTQPDVAPITDERYWHTARVVLRNQLINVPLAMVLAPVVEKRMTFTTAALRELGVGEARAAHLVDEDRLVDERPLACARQGRGVKGGV